MIFRRHREAEVASAFEAGTPDEVAIEDAVELGPDQDAVASGGAGPVMSAAEELAMLRRERLALIELCLYARDRVTSGAVGDRIDAGLIDIGIRPLRPDGERFDPARHEAAATVPTDDPSLHDLVAETEVPGYADRGVVVRPPVVSVYRVDPARVAEP